MNKQSLGLHAWGNIVPSCSFCNSKKHQRPWESYLLISCSEGAKEEAGRKAKILQFISHYRYEPNVELTGVAGNLYEDVGAVAKTLIDLRIRQAEAMLENIHMPQ